MALSELRNAENSVSVTEKGAQLFVRGTEAEVKQVMNLKQKYKDEFGELVELIHTHPGIRNVVPSLPDLERNLPVTILARGDTAGAVTKITYSVAEVKHLRELHKGGLPDDTRRFYNALVEILASRNIKPPDAMLAEMSALGMALPK
ncbi:hypothetical protein [Fimbriiglobus ruber]|uniref:hypothetical protein n=1 Tax=Fimbriiglobus ruber TaxID=1908690 RepID=UPI000B4A5FF3|nr:hypothetical protein [Fimbriiglobus ruber]